MMSSITRAMTMMRLFQEDSSFTSSPLGNQLLATLTFDDGDDDDVAALMTPDIKRAPTAIDTPKEENRTFFTQRVAGSAGSCPRRHRSFESRRTLDFKRRLTDDESFTSSPKKPCLFTASVSPLPEEKENAADCHTDEDNLTGDGMSSWSLPTIPGKHCDLKSVSAETVTELLLGRYDEVIDSYRIIDCRYPYEFNGGHIKEAENIYTEEGILEILESKHGVKQTGRHILIFHCEFSSERGPKKCRFLRNKDRQMNADNYPTLNFPEVYILHGGFKEFFSQRKDMCDPQGYIPMVHKDHAKDLRVFRKKSKSWTAGEKKRYAMKNQQY